MDVIATHINADFDSLGSMIAAKRLYPDAVLVFSGGQERGLRDFLLQSSIYAYDIKRPRDVDFSQITRLILVDVRSAARIGPFAAVARNPDIELHIYDHHPADENSLKGALEVIRPVGATTTILVQIFIDRQIVPTIDEATMMMLGLYEDTGHLLFSGTTPEDFRAAGFLLEHGANLNTVADFLVREMTSEQLELLNDLMQSRRTLLINGVSVTVANASSEEYTGDISSLVHKLKDMENLDALIAVVRMEDRIFIIARSRLPELHVGELLLDFGGGGHGFAASATVRDKPLAQVLKELEEGLSRHVRSRCDAGHLMSRGVKTLPLDAAIKDAKELMTRFNFNAVPILDDKEKVAGILTRQVVEKASFHKLHKLSVGELMSTDFELVSSDATLQELQRVIVEHQQRSVPVVDKGELVGVVTRTDLLRYMLGASSSAENSHVDDFERRGLQTKRKNLQRFIATQLPQPVHQRLRQFGQAADCVGVRAYLVGGCVRDLLLRQNNLDLDIVVEGDGIQFAREFAGTTECRVREHEKFRTAVVIFPDGFKVDITSARIEYYESPAALPTVEHASIRHDLYRRDFTINTLTISLNQESFGQVLDFFGGQRDLRDKSIRVLHNLSFIEDPTRLYRAVRFEQRLGFHIGKQTQRLMHSAVQLNLVRKVGGTRVLNELKYILSESHVIPALERLEEFQLLKIIDARIKLDAEVKRLLLAVGRAVNWFDLLYTGKDCRRWLLFLVCLLAPLPPAGIRKTVNWFGMTMDEKTLFTEQLPRMFAIQRKVRHRLRKQIIPTNSEIYHWFETLEVEIILYLMARSDDDRLRQWISLYMTELRRQTIHIDGHDLIDLGLSPGPQFQEILGAVLDARLDRKISSKEEELEFVRAGYLPRIV